MSFNFTCKLVSKPVDEIYAELRSVNKLKAKHELLCRTLASWRLNLEQNSSQLKILDETAEILNRRHQWVEKMLATRPIDPGMLSRLRWEIRAMEQQIRIWINEIAQVSAERTHAELDYGVNFAHQRVNLQRSITDIELAKLDVDQLDGKHREAWKEFLQEDKNDENGIKGLRE